MRKSVLVCAALGVVLSLQAASAKEECNSVPPAQWSACQIAAGGAPSAQALAGQGRDFIQVLLTKNQGGIVIQIQRAPNGPLVLAFREMHGERAPLASVLPETEWEPLISQWRALPENAAAWHKEEIARRATDEQKGQVTICLHPWFAHVESNLTGKLQALEGNGCDDLPIVEFAWHIAELTLAATPPCGLLDEQHNGHPPTRLAVCLMLTGNRRTAALTLNEAIEFGWSDSKDGWTAAKFLPQIEAEASATVAGRKVRGAANVAKAWAGLLSGLRYPNFSADTVAGRADSAMVTGVIWLQIDGHPYAHFERASVTQIWHRQSDGSFKLRALTAGKFVKVPDR